MKYLCFYSLFVYSIILTQAQILGNTRITLIEDSYKNLYYEFTLFKNEIFKFHFTRGR